jgi:hypothetical protein
MGANPAQNLGLGLPLACIPPHNLKPRPSPDPPLADRCLQIGVPPLFRVVLLQLQATASRRARDLLVPVMPGHRYFQIVRSPDTLIDVEHVI